jgi:hypothetical protein
VYKSILMVPFEASSWSSTKRRRPAGTGDARPSSGRLRGISDCRHRSVRAAAIMEVGGLPPGDAEEGKSRLARTGGPPNRTSDMRCTNLNTEVGPDGNNWRRRSAVSSVGRRTAEAEKRGLNRQCSEKVKELVAIRERLWRSAGLSRRRRSFERRQCFRMIYRTETCEQW